MTIEFDAIYDGEVLRSKTPINLPKGTRILITEIIDEGHGRPKRLIGHIDHRPQNDGGDEAGATGKE